MARGGQTRTTRGFRVPGSSVLLRRRILEMGPLSEFGRVSRCERGRACRASGPSSARSRPGPVSCCCISEGHIQGQTGLSLRHFKGVRDASSHVRGPVRFSPLSCGSKFAREIPALRRDRSPLLLICYYRLLRDYSYVLLCLASTLLNCLRARQLNSCTTRDLT